MKLLIIAICATLAFSGCATRGANYQPIVDMQGHSQGEYASALFDCQGYAKQTHDAAQGAIAGAIIGALLGAALAPRGYRNNVAGYGAGVGALSGAASATDTQENIVRRCMAGRGWNVLN